jgi:hypothetical protein
MDVIFSDFFHYFIMISKTLCNYMQLSRNHFSWDAGFELPL